MPVAVDAALVQPLHAVVRPAGTRWHTVRVRPGDTIWDLALKHRTTVRALVEKNRLRHGGRLIHVGQRLLVPGAAPAAPSAGKAKAAGKGRSAGKVGSTATSKPRPSRTYLVRPGDTLSVIAARHHVSLRALLAANRIANPGLIHVGQRIAIPGASRAASGKGAPAPARPTATSENTFAGYTYSDATVAAARANREALARRHVPTRTETAALIRRVAARYGVDPRLALAIAWQESGWNQRVVSVANAIGTMQVIPSSGRWASDLAGRRLDLLDAEDNVTAGVVIIKALLRGAATREHAIGGYYQGLHSVQNKGLYEDTKRYIAAVLAHYRRM